MGKVSNFLKKMFQSQIVAVSMDDFIDHIPQEKCKDVEITPMHKNMGLAGVPGVTFGTLSLYKEDDMIGEEYYLHLKAMIPSGGSVVYETERVLRCVTLTDAREDHEKEALKLFLRAEASARHLRARLSGVRVDVVFQSGIPIGLATRRELYARAGEYNLFP